jgi:hypothetical protein
MNPLLIAPILEIGKSLIDRFFPDPAERAKAELDMMVLLQTQDLQRVIAQLEVNAKEAASPHLLVAGAAAQVSCGRPSAIQCSPGSPQRRGGPLLP